MCPPTGRRQAGGAAAARRAGQPAAAHAAAAASASARYGQARAVYASGRRRTLRRAGRGSARAVSPPRLLPRLLPRPRSPSPRAAAALLCRASRARQMMIRVIWVFGCTGALWRTGPSLRHPCPTALGESPRGWKRGWAMRRALSRAASSAVCAAARARQRPAPAPAAPAAAHAAAGAPAAAAAAAGRRGLATPAGFADFDHSDALDVGSLLTEEERAVRDAVRDYCQGSLQPRVLEVRDGPACAAQGRLRPRPRVHSHAIMRLHDTRHTHGMTWGCRAAKSLHARSPTRR